MRYDAVIFDNDGVLTHLTDRQVLRRAVRQAFSEVGIDDPDAGHVDQLLAGVTPDLLETLCAPYGLEAGPFWERRDELATAVQQEEIVRGNKPLYDDYDAILDLPVPRGIVSSNQHPTIQKILEHYDIGDHFGTYYGREMTLDGLRRKKPATYYIDRAVADLGAENPVYVGDSESDVLAAQNAGMDSVFIRRDHRRDLQLSLEPTMEITSLRELPAALNGQE